MKCYQRAAPRFFWEVFIFLIFNILKFLDILRLKYNVRQRGIVFLNPTIFQYCIFPFSRCRNSPRRGPSPEIRQLDPQGIDIVIFLNPNQSNSTARAPGWVTSVGVHGPTLKYCARRPPFFFFQAAIFYSDLGCGTILTKWG